MASATEEADNFMEGPLISWFKSCLEDPDVVVDYNDLVDGVLLYQVFLQIDPEPSFCGVAPSQGNPLVRVRNLEILLKNLRSLYQDEFNQLVIMVPNVVRLGTECNSAAAKSDLNLLLLLLLACAVQCPNKEIFIERIKLLPLDVQHSIVDYIKQFTDTPMMVLGAEQETSISHETLLSHVRHLVKERDELLASWASAAAGDNSHAIAEKPRRTVSNASSSESHHLAVELADCKSKLRKQRQELEEKTEALNECRDELEGQRTAVSRLRQEVAEVVQDARSAKAYRDELDVMREKAERAEKLEVELERFKAKLRDVDFFKTRVEELRDDNRVLMETREMLEGQVERARKRGDRVMDLEAQILKLKQQYNELSLERDAKDRKLDELYAEQAELQVLARSAQAADSKLELLSMPSDSGDSSLSSQLSNNATARALRLELENHRLRSAIENLKESAFHEASAKLLESEQENKRMSINMEQMEEQCRRLTAENKELESLVKDALQESRKLQESRQVLRAAVDSQQTELQTSRDQLEAVKRQLETTVEENAKVLPRLKELESGKSAVEEWRLQASLVPDLQEQLAQYKRQLEAGEMQVSGLQKEVLRLKEVVEANHAKEDETTRRMEVAAKEKEQLTEELKAAKAVAARLHEVEVERDEGHSRVHVAEQALQALQSELVQQKVDCQNLKSALSRLGLSSEMLLDPNVTLADLLTIPELKDQLPAELRQECQQCRELAGLREQIARQQVLATTLQSQINSLNSQHTAVQLANTQLAAEKEQLEEERKTERALHEQLLQDQTSLQRLHEQLTSEHETVVMKQEALRQQIRSQQREIQTMRETAGRQEIAQDQARADRDQLHEKTISLKNLRDEHSMLKGDFRELFSNSLKLKEEYGRMQLEYRAARSDASELQMLNAKLKEDVTALSDSERHLQLQLHKLTQANAMLEEDRRSVMDHASILLSQYQDLFTHSLEDNQHYHAEEKQFADRINQLKRQKEKLEEKIMDQYRKLGSTSSKKKGFGATLVRKVRKAGSDLINRSRRSLHEDSRTSVNVHGSESGENESDASFDDTRQEEDSGPLPRILKQQGAGTRQTVYEAEAPGPGSEQGGGRAPPSSLLVINRMSTTTVIGDRGPPSPPSPSLSPSLSLRSQTAEDARRKRKDDIYFDYGCV